MFGKVLDVRVTFLRKAALARLVKSIKRLDIPWVEADTSWAVAYKYVKILYWINLKIQKYFDWIFNLLIFNAKKFAEKIE